MFFCELRKERNTTKHIETKKSVRYSHKSRRTENYVLRASHCFVETLASPNSTGISRFLEVSSAAFSAKKRNANIDSCKQRMHRLT